MQKIIGLVHTRLSPTGGVEGYINKLVAALLERNWQPHYFTAKVERDVPPGMIVHRIPLIRGTSISRMLSFAYGAERAVRRSDLPLVVGFGRTICQDIYRDGSGCFLDYEEHSKKRFNYFYRKSYLHLERKRFNESGLQKVIAISSMVKSQIVSRHNLPQDKIEVVYNGVDEKRFHPGLKRDKALFRRQLRIPEDACTVLFIGNDFERKGVAYLVNGIAELPMQLPLIIIIAGKDKRAKLYEHMAVEAGCRERIRFVGYQEDVGPLFGAADLFVLPSVFDPFGSVVLESLATGTPVVTGKHVGASELIENAVNGFVVPDYLPKTLAQAILSFYYSSNKEEMARQAHRAATAYHWDRHMDRIESLFLEVLDRKSSLH